MVVPNYIYVKLKMPGANEVITVSISFQRSYHCNQEFIALSTTVTTFADHARNGQ
jgi:hypothetical protein